MLGLRMVAEGFVCYFAAESTYLLQETHFRKLVT